jgi:transcriptional regulator with XRE-family HTH domain
MDIEINFFEILANFFESHRITKCTEACEFLRDKGLDVKRTTLSTYLKGEVVPPYEKAKAILNVIGYETSEEELSAILEFSKENKKKSQFEQNKIETKLCLRPQMFGFDNIVIFEEVLTDKYTNKGFENLNDYLIDLIQKDLMN